MTARSICPQVVSNLIKEGKDELAQKLAERLEEDAHLVLGGTPQQPGSWKDPSKVPLSLDKGGFKSYKENGVVSLTRFVRNKVGESGVRRSEYVQDALADPGGGGHLEPRPLPYRRPKMTCLTRGTNRPLGVIF